MKILNCVVTMDVGGIETLLMNILRNIDKTEYQLNFMCILPEKSFYDDEITSLEGKVYHLPKIELNQPRVKRVNERINNIANFFSEHQNEFDIIHVHASRSEEVLEYIVAYKKSKVNKKLIIHSHNTSGESTKKNKFVKRLYKNQNFTRLACSDEAGKWLFEGSDYTLINNGIDLSKFYFNSESREEIRKEFNIDSSTKVIGHVGRFNEQKNHKFIVKIFNEYQKINPNSVLMLVGVGDLQNDIKSELNRLNLTDKVIFTGLRTDVNKVLQAFDLFLFPSLYEGLSVAYVEAAVSGVPVLLAENIPYVKVTNYIYALSLNDSEQVWANKIKKVIDLPRKEVEFNEVKNNYDILFTIKQLKQIYSK